MQTNWVEAFKTYCLCLCNHSFSSKIKIWIQRERSLDTPLLLTKPLKDVNQKRMFTKTNNSDILFLLPATQAGNCLEHREYVWVWVTKANETYKHEETSQKVNAYIGQLGPNLAQLNLLKRNSGDQIVVVWGDSFPIFSYSYMDVRHHLILLHWKLMSQKTFVFSFIPNKC